MTRSAGLMMVWLGLAAGGYLHAASDEDNAPTTTETTAEQTSVKKQQGSRSSRQPAKTFKPSERIRADSAVSFPVDI